MENINNFKEWRAEEIAKIFLFKSEYKLFIDKYPTPLFDFFISLKDYPGIKFAIEVKVSSTFKNNLQKQLSELKMYRDTNMINIPVLIFKIDEKNEKGNIDFLVIPSFIENKLLIRNDFQWLELNQKNLKSKIDTIIKWHNRE